MISQLTENQSATNLINQILRKNISFSYIWIRTEYDIWRHHINYNQLYFLSLCCVYYLFLLVSQEDKTSVNAGLMFCATVLREISWAKIKKGLFNCIYWDFQGVAEPAVSSEVVKPVSHSQYSGSGWHEWMKNQPTTLGGSRGGCTVVWFKISPAAFAALNTGAQKQKWAISFQYSWFCS